MADFSGADLRGSRFERADLSGAQFWASDLTGAWLRGVDLHGVVMRGVELCDVDINGEIRNVTINGVDVGPLIEAELDRRDPDRAKMRPDDPAGFRAAWDILERRWEQTVERARRLPPERLHESVDGEWSFIETLRHLVFATDAWVEPRDPGGDPSPWEPLACLGRDARRRPAVPRDRDARPSLDAGARAARATGWPPSRDVLASLTDESLARHTTPVTGPGCPEPESFPVRGCLLIVLNEEWQHRLYAERDLAALESRVVES